MESRGLGKGGNAPVNGDRCTVVVASSSIDVLTFQLGADDRVRSDADVVFYNQPNSPEGAVQLTGPGTVTVLLDLVPASVVTVAIAVAVADEHATSPLSAGVDLTLTTDVDDFRWRAEGLGIERAAILAELYRRNGTWKLRNVSAGWEQGLPALFTHFGVAVDDGADAPVHPAQQVPVPPPPPVSPLAQPTPVPATPATAPPPAPAAQRSGGPTQLAPARKKGAKKRIAWAAAVVVAVLVVAGVLGRKPDSNQNTAQPVPAAAQMSITSPSPSLGSSSAQSTLRSPARTTLPASAAPLLAAPPAVSVIRTALAAQAAVTTLQKLRVAGRSSKSGYSRAQFGQAWTDDTAVAGGHNGCDTRNDILRRDLRQITLRAGSRGCAVTSGSLADPYTGKALAFSSSRAAGVQIDHVVALSNAWQTGAAALSPVLRQDLANDPLNLQATSGPVNQAKGDGDAATWLPPAKAYRCTYVARQVAVKARYGLWVTAAERHAISTVLTGCGAAPAPPLSRPTATSTRAPAPATARAPATVAAVVPVPRAPVTTTTVTTTRRPPTTAVVEQPPAPTTTEEAVTTTESSTEQVETTVTSTAPADDGFYYENCTAARAAGVTPLHTGDPGYRSGLDRDHDGIACE